MKRKKQILTAVILSGSVGLGAQSILGQSSPGGAGRSDPVPGQPGTIPERVERPGAETQKQGLASSDDIKKAKEALKAKGHNPGDIDGNMDAKTQQAIRDFQKANKLPVTGVLDQETAQKLGVSLGDKGSSPQRGESPMPRGGSSGPSGGSDLPRGGSSGPSGGSDLPSGKGSTR
jgi:peptidoglycan hydrolase-like protein with peptidoglycan-binding domain